MRFLWLSHTTPARTRSGCAATRRTARTRSRSSAWTGSSGSGACSAARPRWPSNSWRRGAPRSDRGVGHARPDDFLRADPSDHGAHAARSISTKTNSPTRRDHAKKTSSTTPFINFTSALAADAVFSTASSTAATSCATCRACSSTSPTIRCCTPSRRSATKSAVLPVGLDLARYEAHRPAAAHDPSRPPLIV